MVKKDEPIAGTEYTRWINRNILLGFDSSDNSNILKIDDKVALDVYIQDQYTEAIDLYLCQLNGTTNPTTPLILDGKTVTVVSTTGAVIGDCINIKDADNYFQSIVSAINGNVISFATPVDKAFGIDATVCFGEWNLATANGSVTPVTFFICPPENTIYDIYDISVSFEDNTAMYESTFGGIPQLTNGLIIRHTDGSKKNLALISNNAGFREYGFVTSYPDKVPSGTYAFWADKNYRDINGVSLRIDGTKLDRIEVIVQDDLTGLTKLAITVHGHKVQD